MKYLANTILESVKQEIGEVCAKTDENVGGKLIYVMPTFPPEVVTQIGDEMEDFALSQTGNIRVILKIAYKLGKIWADSQRREDYSAYNYIVKKGWYDTDNHLTSTRNMPRATDEVLVIILVGADRVTDQSSLDDFHKIDKKTIWGEFLKHNFESWIEEKLLESSVFYESDALYSLNEILTSLLNLDLADVVQISEFLEDLDLSAAQDGRDALHIVLSQMGRFKLPCMRDFPSSGRSSFQDYANDALSFFDYRDYRDTTKRNRALKAVEDFREEHKDKGDDAIDPDDRESYDAVEDLLSDLTRYIGSNDASAKQRLYEANFTVIRDEILGFRRRKPRDRSRSTVRKLSGSLVEVILWALWVTLSDFKKEAIDRGISAHEVITGIAIKSKIFKHDCGGENSQQRAQNAKAYLEHLIGGIDDIVREYLEIAGTDMVNSGEYIDVASKLMPSNNNEISFPSARTGEPCLQFEVSIKAGEDWAKQRDFAWRLPETQPHRIAYELFKWVSKGISFNQNQAYCLPTFTVPYYTELMQAKDDEESHRVLLQCLKSEDNPIVNLLDDRDIDDGDPALEKVRKLAYDYCLFIQEAVDKGFFAALRGFPKMLRKSYDGAYTNAMESNSYLMRLLFRAFLILRKKNSPGNTQWYWNRYEPSAIVTVLHPALLEMMIEQIAYLFECFNRLSYEELRSPGVRAFRESKWLRLADLAKIQNPITGIIQDENRILNTDMHGTDLIYKIGSDEDFSATLTTRLLLRYDAFEDDSISDSELFQSSSDSALVQRVLKDYCSLHPHSHDGISIAVYTSRDIQPVIAGVDDFLKSLLSKRESKYLFSLSLTMFSESQDDVTLARWVDEWKERWDSTEPRFDYYRSCRISVSQRIVSPDENYRQFQDLINDGLESDIAFLIRFIKAGSSGNEFRKVEPYDVTQRSLLFPILEKAFCAWRDPGESRRRARIISNRQFRLSALHSEIMARLQNPDVSPEAEHAVLGFGDFSMWDGVVDKLHEKCEWVVCIDPSVDERLIRKDNLSGERKREIIGFGSGVGPHGEQNYTISTEQFRLSDVKRKISSHMQSILGPWEESFSDGIADSILSESMKLSGLSLVKATGVGDYIRDFAAYSLTRKLLPNYEGLLCDELVSLDAYQHWFDTAESDTRPDLLWLTAWIYDGLINIRAYLIECKFAMRSERHEEKARVQLESGLDHLLSCFRPRAGKSAAEESQRPDQRYWWLQLHRLIASKSAIRRQEEEEALSALERLSEGYFSIQWMASAITYWTDDESGTLVDKGHWDFTFGDKVLQINILTAGRQFIKALCCGDLDTKLILTEDPIHFESLPQEKRHIHTDGKTDGVDAEDHPTEEHGDSDLTGTVEKLSLQVSTQERETTDSKTDTEPAYTVCMSERIFLGRSITGNREIYWEFGHPELPNRHILIFGASGMGKTYTIQALLCELGTFTQNSLIVDYTSGFQDSQLESITREALNPTQHVVRYAPLPINPFRQQYDFIESERIQEKPVHTAQRVAGVFDEVYNLGDQQKSALYSAVKSGIESFKQEMSLPRLVDQLRAIVEQGGVTSNSAQSILSKVQPFVDSEPFGDEEPESWEKLFTDNESRCHILQLATFSKDAARLITEFSLIDLYWYYRGNGSKDEPRIIVLDEIQNLDHRLESPLGQFLTEGRKFGISLILATQTLSNLSKDERDRLFQACHKLFFKPADTEVRDYAQILQNATGDKLEIWIQRLSALKKGQCYSLGPSLNEVNGVLETKPFRIRIDSLESRFGNRR